MNFCLTFELRTVSFILGSNRKRWKLLGIVITKVSLKVLKKMMAKAIMHAHKKTLIGFAYTDGGHHGGTHYAIRD